MQAQQNKFFFGAFGTDDNNAQTAILYTLQEEMQNSPVKWNINSEQTWPDYASFYMTRTDTQFYQKSDLAVYTLLRKRFPVNSDKENEFNKRLLNHHANLVDLPLNKTVNLVDLLSGNVNHTSIKEKVQTNEILRFNSRHILDPAKEAAPSNVAQMYIHERVVRIGKNFWISIVTRTTVMPGFGNFIDIDAMN